MASGNETQRRDRLNDAELASFESDLRKEGYRLTSKTNEAELLPGEYLKRKRSTYVYAYASPIVWEVVWADRARRPVSSRSKRESRHTRR